MSSFWIWLLLLGTSWSLAITHFHTNITAMPLRIVGSAVFFALFFLSPLLRKNKIVYTVTLSIAAILAVIVFWPESTSTTPNPYVLLILSILAGKATYRLHGKQATIVGILLYIGAMAPSFNGYSSFSQVYITLYAILLAVGLTLYKRLSLHEEEITLRNEALLTEYRKMKRQLISEEKLARQDERAQIAREIHDSVGHKLTALLMQLEVFRMQSKSESSDQIMELKKLAKDSLEETRNAVKALKQDEAGGLSAIIRLIRKLEAESFIRVHFSMKHGALSASLSNDQAIAVYRSVQEAITNMMRHSGTKEIDILFESPGGTIFRFEVSNLVKEDISYKEGFGLTSMRERIEQSGGSLEVKIYKGRFVVRGQFPLLKKE